MTHGRLSLGGNRLAAGSAGGRFSESALIGQLCPRRVKVGESAFVVAGSGDVAEPGRCRRSPFAGGSSGVVDSSRCQRMSRMADPHPMFYTVLALITQ
jgi:hypothetical protein